MSSTSGTNTPAGSGEIRIGISSWGSLPGFYPSRIKSGDKLAWYAKFFSVVEINVSYYRIVPPRTYDQWIDATPDGFLFDVKAFGDLTHFREAPPHQTFVDFRNSYEPLRAAGRLGGVLFQFPPRFSNAAAARNFLRRVSTIMEDDQAIIEFRNFTWLSPENADATLALLAELNLAYCIADEPYIPNDTVPPLPAVTDPDLAYIRFHGRDADGWYRGGGGSRYDYDYSTAELSEWAATVADLSCQARAVHVMFNNNARGAGTRNALEFGRMLGVSPEVTPELPFAQSQLFDEAP